MKEYSTLILKDYTYKINVILNIFCYFCTISWELVVWDLVARYMYACRAMYKLEGKITTGMADILKG